MTAALLTEHPYDPDSGHKHGCSPCCRLAWLLRATPDDTQRELHRGGITADEFEAYMHVWATTVDRFSHVADQWRAVPDDADVAAIADALRLADKAERAPEGPTP